jgi:hypothetical protein
MFLNLKESYKILDVFFPEYRILLVKQIFNECGFPNIWETELFDNVDYLKCVIKQRLEDQFLQNWNSLVQNSPKAINYKTFKTEFKYEPSNIRF